MTMRMSIWMLAAVTVGLLAPPAPARADARDDLLAYVVRVAERDFEAVRGEAGLSGSAPLVGLKAEAKPVGKRARRQAARAAAKARSETRRVTAVGDDAKASLGHP